jgi:hypothetical protein
MSVHGAMTPDSKPGLTSGLGPGDGVGVKVGGGVVDVGVGDGGDAVGVAVGVGLGSDAEGTAVGLGATDGPAEGDAEPPGLGLTALPGSSWLSCASSGGIRSRIFTTSAAAARHFGSLTSEMALVASIVWSSSV